MLKKVILGLCLSSIFFVNSAFAGESVKFVVDVKPLSFLVAEDIDGFYSYNSSYYSYRSETVDGSALWTPHLKAGIGFNIGDKVGIDVTGGLGYMIGGEVLSAPFLTLDAALLFKLGSAITIGPHIGLISIDEIDWDGESDIELSDTQGVYGGLVFTAGKEKFSFCLAIDAVSLDDIEVTDGAAWTSSRDTIDLSGWKIDLGMKMRF